MTGCGCFSLCEKLAGRCDERPEMIASEGSGPFCADLQQSIQRAEPGGTGYQRQDPNNDQDDAQAASDHAAQIQGDQDDTQHYPDDPVNPRFISEAHCILSLFLYITIDVSALFDAVDPKKLRPIE
jgi:hypothetical protein